jgi:hypothetical protein
MSTLINSIISNNIGDIKMPRVISPDGVPLNIPATLNGRQLKQEFKIPANKVLTKVDESDTEVLVKDDDQVHINEGDKFDATTRFDRGY